MRSTFLLDVFLLFMSLPSKLNFLQLSRYGSLSERTYRRHFHRDFDFLQFNRLLVQEVSSRQRVLAFDPCYLPKSGKKTYGVASFWSGVEGRAKKGLELAGIACIDLSTREAYHLEAVQTPSHATETKASLPDHYLSLLTARKADLEILSDYLVADGYFYKRNFVKGLCTDTSLHLISKMRKDADCQYLYTGAPTGKKGCPKIYDGKVKWQTIDKEKFVLEQETPQYRCYGAVLYAKALQRKVKVAYLELRKKNGEAKGYQLLFSTDLSLSSNRIVDYYKARFQIEFLFRDAKQHTGLTQCQARSKEKLYFHTNTALTAVSIAKAVRYKGKTSKEKPFSLRNIQQRLFYELILQRFFRIFEVNPNPDKLDQQIRKLHEVSQITT